MKQSAVRKKRKRVKRLLILAMLLLAGTLTALAAVVLKKMILKSGTLSVLQASGSVSRQQLAELKEKKEDLPQRLLDALENNYELVDFALGYSEKIGTYEEQITLEPQEDRAIPLFLQWDQRWGYARYGDGCIGLDGCGPTCLSMVLAGLTGDFSQNPKRIADFSMENGYVSEGSSTSWALMTDGAASLGLSVREVPLDQQKMIRALEAGQPIICSVRQGDFTTVGHFIVIFQYRDGSFRVNDPNSTLRSSQTYSFERLSPQIKGMWAYEKQ